MNNHATFEDLIARKLEREARRERTYEIAVKGMERPLRMDHPSAMRQLDLMDELKTVDGLADLAELYVRLIYDCCPVFRAKETQEALDAVDPYDAIRTVFEPLEIIEIGDQFCVACGLIEKPAKGDEADKGNSLNDQVKN